MAASGSRRSRYLARWPEIAARGRTSFVVREALRFAAFTLPLIWLASWALGWEDGQPWGAMPTGRLVKQLIFFPIGGLFVGLMMWTVNSRDYRKQFTAGGTASN